MPRIGSFRSTTRDEIIKAIITGLITVVLVVPLTIYVQRWVNGPSDFERSVDVLTLEMVSIQEEMLDYVNRYFNGGAHSSEFTDRISSYNGFLGDLKTARSKVIQRFPIHETKITEILEPLMCQVRYRPIDPCSIQLNNVHDSLCGCDHGTGEEIATGVYNKYILWLHGSLDKQIDSGLPDRTGERNRIGQSLETNLRLTTDIAIKELKEYSQLFR